MTIDEKLTLLGRGVVPRVWEMMKDPLRKKLESGRELLIKVGFDPTAPDLHLGHTVVMHKMRQFQELGHQVVFLIGDFTAMIGDPTGRSSTRPALTREQVLENAETYKKQVFKILDADKTAVRFNSEWLAPLTAEELVQLTAHYTVARLLERNDFNSRYQKGQPISVQEFLYPLLQAYDSVVLKADVELGGNDQLFNLMVGRDIMPKYALEPQVVLTTELLVGTEGRWEDEKLVGEKMSKSLGNYVGVDDPPGGEHGIFGKLMSISDEVMWHYYDLLSSVTPAQLEAVKAGHPKEAKRTLASEITSRYHGNDATEEASAEFDRLHPAKGANRGVPEDVETVEISVEGEAMPLFKVLHQVGLTKSGGEGRRLIKQGGVQVDGERVTDESRPLSRGSEHLLKAGKRRFRRVVLR
ncbi:MAG: tyrosine--tRNA ligase [Deltaproteobacteria bacterium]|nr:tyrosine--tRNA ligase [Deltaproteobacteria bacterium]